MIIKEHYSKWAEKRATIQNKLLYLVDEDTNAFNKIIEGFRMPKGTDEEKATRSKAIEEATKYATEIPFQVMETAFNSMEVMQAMVKEGLQSSLSDAGVGAICARTAVVGAYFNVRINAKDIKDRAFAESIVKKADKIYYSALAVEKEIIDFVNTKM
ncbi:MAG: cyclodeaminase/cyclohydrolase family protein [Flavobacteriaceae bacterium]